ncbi:MAG: FadR/GntR family transcriptional regulator [Rhodocyclaceae bacterium]
MNKQNQGKVDHIICQLGQQIVAGKYLPGAALPTEADLCAEFDTSRNVIREVQQALLAKRLIIVRRHKGAYVGGRAQWNYLDSDVLGWALCHDGDPRLLAALSEVRDFIEPQIARWAAIRATSRDLVNMEAALNDMTQHNQDRDPFNEADIRFHEAVLESVHNPILKQLGVAISSLQRVVFTRTYMGDEDNMPRTLREHRTLFDAIRRQDPASAEKAAHTLVASAARRLKGLL